MATATIAECFYFCRRNQAVGETVVKYAAELRRLSTHWRFPRTRSQRPVRVRLTQRSHTEETTHGARPRLQTSDRDC